jgi:hypothetical protein
LEDGHEDGQNHPMLLELRQRQDAFKEVPLGGGFFSVVRLHAEDRKITAKPPRLGIHRNDLMGFLYSTSAVGGAPGIV